MASRRATWRRIVGGCVGSACALATVALSVVHCGNDAVAVEGCRTIENKRCEAAMGCTDGIADEDDVTACKLFYRDQCMFGMAVEEAPGEPAVDACVAALDQAAVCKTAALSECADPPALGGGASFERTGCYLILNPELLADCSFLLPAEEGQGGSSSSGTGGTGGSGGSAGGAGGGGVN
ncbi:MAG: hypothetical protein JRI68_25500 [Deltaproteobacteria bacterium]|nr:hypothetical protein [Deltaproteobacteria bacterium]